MTANHPISLYLKHEEYIEALNHETLVRWQEAEQGNVVSHEAVCQWLNTWGTDKEDNRPHYGETI